MIFVVEGTAEGMWYIWLPNFYRPQCDLCLKVKAIKHITYPIRWSNDSTKGWCVRTVRYGVCAVCSMFVSLENLFTGD